ncbi:hypothetical protein L1987_11218 [Smallanthus sonchifolius]|uniref:Uncharacterized protein n=1 Tax=Smallanthus sonchifolius TaxID=185202 RepID=A0ACB9JCK8_9ASTR|nr:hypothetical protein L1987_11218 [Smallanthus sonchifolius]
MDMIFWRKTRKSERTTTSRILWKNLYGEAAETFRTRVAERVAAEVENIIQYDADKWWKCLAHAIREVGKEALGVMAGGAFSALGFRFLS